MSAALAREILKLLANCGWQHYDCPKFGEGNQMADDKGELLPAEAFPPTGFPNVFADGVLSISNSSSIVKFYLFRFEPTYQGAGEAKAQAFAQVVMPLDSFAQTCVFFENTLANYVKGGLITEERLNELRKSFASNQAKP